MYFCEVVRREIMKMLTVWGVVIIVTSTVHYFLHANYHLLQATMSVIQNLEVVCYSVATVALHFDSQWLSSLPAGLLMLMGWRICGALVQLNCYQHRYEWKDLWCSSTVTVQHKYEAPLTVLGLALNYHNNIEISVGACSSVCYYV